MWRIGKVERNEEECGEGTAIWSQLDPIALLVTPASAILCLGILDPP